MPSFNMPALEIRSHGRSQDEVRRQRREPNTPEDDDLGELRSALSDLRSAAEGLDELREEVRQQGENLTDLHRRHARGMIGAGGEAEGTTREAREHANAFRSWLRNPRGAEAMGQLREMEQRAASGLTDPAGGFIVPEVLVGPLLQRVRDADPIRDLARVIDVSSGDVVLPISNNDATTGWVGELDPRNPTNEPTLDGPRPTFGTVFAYVSASEELYGDAAFDISDWFTEAVGDAIGEAESSAFIVGNGTKKPTGILNTPPEAGADGARTAGALRFLWSGAAADVTPDALVDLIYDLKAGYRRGASWLMSSATVAAVRKLKDDNGRFLWTDGIAAGQPATLLGFPVRTCEAMPALAADATPILFGDFRRGYAIADRGGIAVTVDPNITEPGRVKWYVRRRVGGTVHDANAIRALKIGTGV